MLGELRVHIKRKIENTEISEERDSIARTPKISGPR